MVEQQNFRPKKQNGIGQNVCCAKCILLCLIGCTIRAVICLPEALFHREPIENRHTALLDTTWATP